MQVKEIVPIAVGNGFCQTLTVNLPGGTAVKVTQMGAAHQQYVTTLAPGPSVDQFDWCNPNEEKKNFKLRWRIDFDI